MDGMWNEYSSAHDFLRNISIERLYSHIIDSFINDGSLHDYCCVYQFNENTQTKFWCAIVIRETDFRRIAATFEI